MRLRSSYMPAILAFPMLVRSRKETRYRKLSCGILVRTVQPSNAEWRRKTKSSEHFTNPRDQLEVEQPQQALFLR